ncbi:D-aspartate oxidase [Teleopsis dalmanni]|uniref:D-aspartate oxidase n=1 Tax=Teleopsis dalmanni TaxID=139649 RepID=UPI0018CD4B0F|nr:D-aspartate oxidase [Teleopsis dalmanni]
MHIAIVGGGINGFCCAVRILEHFQANKTPIKVTVISEEFSPNTTGDGSAGLWGPYLLGGTPTNKVHKWSKGMHDFLQELWLSEDAGEAGVCLIPVVRLSTNDVKVEDFWKDIVYGCAPLAEAELREWSTTRAKKFTDGLHFVTYTSEPLKLLPYLMKRFQKNGGKIVQQRVEDLNEIINNDQYDIVINCTGLGSRELLKDANMHAVRGQVSRVKANWLYFVVLDESDDGNYIIPNTESVVLGGTHQKDDYNKVVCPNDKKFIIDGCREIVPGLTNAQHLFDWVGLRPGRTSLRLDVDKNVKKIIIHNYGHGGSGVTLAWGCAADVLDLLINEMKNRNLVKSKL